MATIAAEAPEWDVHDLPANTIVQLTKLTTSKKYKLSEFHYFDRRRWETVGNDEFLVEDLILRKGGVYMKAQLQKELETLTTLLSLERVDMEVKAKSDGTLAVKIEFTDSTWCHAKRFRCINAGPFPKLKQIEMDSDMMEKEVLENLRPCLLPRCVHREILQMMREQKKVSGRLLLKIRDRVDKWYHDNGYECAGVASFGNLDSEEIVCEIAEGVITEIAIQFIDELGNICKGNTQLSDVRKEIPNQLREGQVYNKKVGKQAVENIDSLGSFSVVEIQGKMDEENKGGMILLIRLTELEHEPIEVSSIERTPRTTALISQNDDGDDENEPFDEDYDDDDEADPRFDGNTSIWFWLRSIVASFSWTL